MVTSNHSFTRGRVRAKQKSSAIWYLQDSYFFFLRRRRRHCRLKLLPDDRYKVCVADHMYGNNYILHAPLKTNIGCLILLSGHRHGERIS